MTLSDLIQRVSEATGPDRELDAYIARDVDGLPMTFCDFDTGCYHGDCKSPGCGKPLGLHDGRKSYPRDWQDDDRLPRYSASIDAALALVSRLLPGWFVLFNTGSVAPGAWSKVDTRPRAELAEPIETKFGSGVGIRAQVHGATPPLAILQALLSALQSQAKTVA